MRSESLAEASPVHLDAGVRGDHDAHQCSLWDEVAFAPAHIEAQCPISADDWDLMYRALLDCITHVAAGQPTGPASHAPPLEVRQQEVVHLHARLTVCLADLSLLVRACGAGR